MKTSRLEAFSDGVLAIIITIMVLELKAPAGHDFAALRDAADGGLSYLLSFIYVGIYWNNHHHMFQLTERITGSVLWANLGLLFFLSLFPYTTSWMDDTSYARVPVLTYEVNLLAAAIAYFVLQAAIIRAHGANSPLRQAVGRDVKGKVSPVCYLVGVAGCLIDRHGHVGVWIALGMAVVVAGLWVVPDRRIDRAIHEHGTPDDG